MLSTAGLYKCTFRTDYRTDFSVTTVFHNVLFLQWKANFFLCGKELERVVKTLNDRHFMTGGGRLQLR